ncbi:MAG: hypothetical protein ACFFB3_17510 [Candidatus Hodarchaeota archaeon]
MPLLEEFSRILKANGIVHFMEYVIEDSLFQLLIEDLVCQIPEPFPPVYQSIFQGAGALTKEKIKAKFENSPFKITDYDPLPNLRKFLLKKRIDRF